MLSFRPHSIEEESTNVRRMALHRLLVALVLPSAFAIALQVIDLLPSYPSTAETLMDYDMTVSKRVSADGADNLPLANGRRRRGYNAKRNRFSDEDNGLDPIEAPESVPDLLESEFGIFADVAESTTTALYPYSHWQDLSSAINEPQAQSVHAHFIHHYAGSMGAQKPPRRNFSDRFEFDMTHNGGHTADISLESEFGEFVDVNRPKRKKVKATILKVTKPPKYAPNLDVSASTLNVTNIVRKYLIRMHKRKKTVNPPRMMRKHTLVDGAFAAGNNAIALDDSWTDGTSADDKGANKRFTTLTDGEEKFVGDTYATTFETIKNKTKHYAKKLLSLFTVVQFSNAHCQATSTASQYEGTCYLPSECADRSGIEMGACAQGHGVCCVFRGTCGAVGSSNCTYLESPGYPSYFPDNGGVVTPTRPPPTPAPPLTPDPRIRQDVDADALSCIFRMSKANDSIRQMRIDFVDLELAGPLNGTCIRERLTITGAGLTMSVPAICGYNTGQHVYVDVSSMIGPLQLAVLATTITRKRYKLRICQYTDGCDGLNCLQQFSGRSGVISSFNYDEAATFSRSSPGYLNNLNYAICIRRVPGFCSITYSNIAADGVAYPFELRNLENGMLTTPAGQAGVGLVNCPDDYIVIDGLRLCGDRLNDGSMTGNFSRNAPVTDTSGGPIVIPVRTSAMSNARGFKLFYVQDPCSMMRSAAEDARIEK